MRNKNYVNKRQSYLAKQSISSVTEDHQNTFKTEVLLCQSNFPSLPAWFKSSRNTIQSHRSAYSQSQKRRSQTTISGKQDFKIVAFGVFKTDALKNQTNLEENSERPSRIHSRRSSRSHFYKKKNFSLNQLARRLTESKMRRQSSLDTQASPHFKIKAKSKCFSINQKIRPAAEALINYSKNQSRSTVRSNIQFAKVQNQNEKIKEYRPWSPQKHVTDICTFAGLQNLIHHN